MLKAQIAVRLGTLDLDIAIEVAAGEIVAVLGPNGAGKTTFLRALSGLVPLDAGRVALDDVVFDDVSSGIHLAPERRPIGVVFQDYLLFPHLSALENVAFGLRARGASTKNARAAAGHVALRGGAAIQSADGVDGEVFATVHPRAVALHRARPEGSPRNVWRGHASALDFQGDRVRVGIEGEMPIVAEVTPAAVRELDLAEGGEVWVSVKATEISVYPA